MLGAKRERQTTLKNFRFFMRGINIGGKNLSQRKFTTNAFTAVLQETTR